MYLEKTEVKWRENIYQIYTRTKNNIKPKEDEDCHYRMYNRKPPRLKKAFCNQAFCH